MKTTVTRNDFVDSFRAYGRLDNFSLEALDLLFTYLEEYEESTGQEIELDVVAICCDYNEDSWQNIAESFDVGIEDLDEDEAKQHVMNYLCDNTSVIGETASGFVYAVF